MRRRGRTRSATRPTGRSPRGALPEGRGGDGLGGEDAGHLRAARPRRGPGRGGGDTRGRRPREEGAAPFSPLGQLPFWRGQDTRLASTRIKIFDLFPRSGLPPAFRTWGEFEGHVEALVAAGSIPDYTWCWWDVRPHPRFGTVEVRALDAQTNPANTGALAALIQCLVAHSAEEAFVPEDPLLTNENKWRATRYGLDATFHDFATGRAAGAREEARDLVRRLRPISGELGCEEELEGVLGIVDGGSGAERQRAVFAKRGSLKAVAEHTLGVVPG
ncbi:hypothetical protein GBA65_20130 [Rubrobacter marinus]|uniref:Glutamate--cysteine ligase n=1 Tax=Rubrobacter marinus TaxID=2653852 RepID=A0A6G8Q1U6_9ACTN|nr:hypothetical protein GBA65_20130 [Rubrobacter marinus]